MSDAAERSGAAPRVRSLPVEAPPAATALAVLAVLTVIAGAPLLGPGWFSSHETLPLPERVIAYGHEMRSGNPYPRWLSVADAGKGSAFANFYAPLVYLVAGGLFAGGLPLFASLKAVMLAAFFAGGAGTHLWLRPRLGAAGALLGAALYLLAPYHWTSTCAARSPSSGRSRCCPGCSPGSIAASRRRARSAGRSSWRGRPAASS
jgi:hypothetical protein